MIADLPVEIRERPRWVVWRFEQRDGKPKPTKVPYMATHPMVRAASTRPSTWGSFSAALAAVEAGHAVGVGIVLGDGVAGVDLDGVRDFQSGAITPKALEIIRSVDSYSETSPTGTGVHILAHGTLPPGRRKQDDVEMYDRDRYFTVTGQHLAGTPRTIEERTPALAALHRRIFGAPIALRPLPPRRFDLALEQDDARLIQRAHDARNGAKFAALWRGDASAYPSHSEADLALVNQLSYWTGGDASRVDRLFRQSGLYRPKWDACRGAQTYGERTIARAVTSVEAVRRRAGTLTGDEVQGGELASAAGADTGASTCSPARRPA